MHDLLREQVEVHILIEVFHRVHLIPILAEVLDKLGIRLGKGLRVPQAHDGVHGVIRADGIHADPLDLHVDAPLGEIG